MKRIILVMLLIAVYQLTIANTNEESLYFKKTLSGEFSEITMRVKDALKTQGFSVITEIDMDKIIPNAAKFLDNKLRPVNLGASSSLRHAAGAIFLNQSLERFVNDNSLF